MKCKGISYPRCCEECKKKGKCKTEKQFKQWHEQNMAMIDSGSLD